jgi:hypothetical protein
MRVADLEDEILADLRDAVATPCSASSDFIEAILPPVTALASSVRESPAATAVCYRPDA